LVSAAERSFNAVRVEHTLPEVSREERESEIRSTREAHPSSRRRCGKHAAPEDHSRRSALQAPGGALMWKTRQVVKARRRPFEAREEKPPPVVGDVPAAEWCCGDRRSRRRAERSVENA